MEKRGAGTNQFGVGLGKMRKLAKAYYPNTELALALWETGNTDAAQLATMVADPADFSVELLTKWAEEITYTRLADEFANNIVVLSKAAENLVENWCESPDPVLGRIGWQARVNWLMKGNYDLEQVRTIMEAIEAEIHTAPTIKMETMNRTLAEIGIKYEVLRADAIAAGERIGYIDQRKVHKGCTAPYVPLWIDVVLKKKNDKK